MKLSIIAFTIAAFIVSSAHAESLRDQFEQMQREQQQMQRDMREQEQRQRDRDFADFEKERQQKQERRWKELLER